MLWSVCYVELKRRRWSISYYNVKEWERLESYTEMMKDSALKKFCLRTVQTISFWVQKQWHSTRKTLFPSFTPISTVAKWKRLRRTVSVASSVTCIQLNPVHASRLRRPTTSTDTGTETGKTLEASKLANGNNQHAWLESIQYCSSPHRAWSPDALCYSNYMRMPPYMFYLVLRNIKCKKTLRFLEATPAAIFISDFEAKPVDYHTSNCNAIYKAFKSNHLS